MWFGQGRQDAQQDAQRAAGLAPAHGHSLTQCPALEALKPLDGIQTGTNPRELNLS